MEELPALHLQYKTWKQFWMALSPRAKAQDGISIIKTVDIDGFKDFHVNQIKEGVFREAIVEPDPEDFTLDDLDLLGSLLAGCHPGSLTIRENQLRVKIETKFKKLLDEKRNGC